MEALNSALTQNEEGSRIRIRWHHRKSIDTKFLVYIAFLQLQGKKIKLSHKFYGKIGYDFNNIDNHEYWPVGRVHYNFHMLVLIGMLNSTTNTVNIRYPFNANKRYMLNNKEINNLLNVLNELEFPLCTIHAVIDSVRFPFRSTEDQVDTEIRRRRPMFKKKKVGEKLTTQVMNFIGVNRNVKSARNT